MPNWYVQRTKARKSRVTVCRSIGASIGSPVINQAIEEDLLCDNQSRAVTVGEQEVIRPPTVTPRCRCSRKTGLSVTSLSPVPWQWGIYR